MFGTAKRGIEPEAPHKKQGVTVAFNRHIPSPQEKRVIQPRVTLKHVPSLKKIEEVDSEVDAKQHANRKLKGLASFYKSEVLFSGAMFFWREEIYADIDIIEHTHYQYIEICAFDIEQHASAPRLYFPLDKLESMATENAQIDMTVIDASSSDSSEKSPTTIHTNYGLSTRKVGVEPSHASQKIVDFILSRIYVMYDKNHSALQAALKDESLTPNDPFYLTKPHGLIEHTIVRTRKPTKEEFDGYVTALKEELLKLSLSTQKVGELREKGITGIIVNKIRQNKKYTHQSLNSSTSEPGKRWARTINLIRKHIRVSRFRQKLGMPSLPALNRGELVEMHDTEPLADVEEFARQEEARARRLSNVHKWRERDRWCDC